MFLTELYASSLCYNSKLIQTKGEETMKVTTFGKWEVERTTLVEQLLSNDAISSLVSRDILNDALLGPVHAGMHAAAIGFTRANKTMPLRELVINSFKQSLLGVLENLSKALSIDAGLLAPCVETFCKDAEEAIPDFIDDLLAIGSLSNRYKKEALSQFYGDDFDKIHPDLSRSLVLQDKEISMYAAHHIAATVSEIPRVQSLEFIKEVIKHIGEIASQIETTEEFKETFLKETGMTMEAHKKMTAEHSSLAGLPRYSLFPLAKAVVATHDSTLMTGPPL